MPCTIVDYLQSVNQNNVAVPLIGQPVMAQPTIAPLWLYNAALSAYELDLYPQRSTVSGLRGAWSLTLPTPAETRPALGGATTQWIITLPDGTAYRGTVPTLSGPLNLTTLFTTYGWQQTTPDGVVVSLSSTGGAILSVPTPPFPAAGQLLTNTSGAAVTAFIWTNGALSFTPSVDGTVLTGPIPPTLAVTIPAGSTFAPGAYTGGPPTWIWFPFSPPGIWFTP